jgi:hypothetical protein
MNQKQNLLEFFQLKHVSVVRLQGFKNGEAENSNLLGYALITRAQVL